MTCPICASRHTTLFHTMNRVPFMQNIRCETRESAVAVPTGQLAMTGCRECGFVWNAAFDEAILKYDANYENDQGWSPTFAAHVAGRVKTVADAAPPDAGCIVEVGCGQGQFLASVATQLEQPAHLFGFDPAWRGAAGEGPGDARISRDFYDAISATRLPATPDVLVSRHTIEHVADPRGFLRAIRSATATRPATTFLETPCVNWIIANGQVQDLFYEHCSLFTAHSLALALTMEGFGESVVTHVFDGQYLWSRSGDGEAAPPPIEIADFAGWTARTVAYLDHWKGLLRKAPRIHLWGAGSKGVIFALLMETVGVGIEGVVDINPKKQGCYLPLTGIPVTAPSAAELQGSTIVVMNPAYRDEIEQSVRAGGVEANILCLN